MVIFFGDPAGDGRIWQDGSKWGLFGLDVLFLLGDLVVGKYSFLMFFVSKWCGMYLFVFLFGLGGVGIGNTLVAS